MPRIFKLFRSQKRRSSSSSSTPFAKRKKEGIFRSSVGKKSKKISQIETPLIEAAITYTLSEDEDSCNIILSPNTDIENKFSEREKELKVAHVNAHDEATDGSVLTNETDEIAKVNSTTPEMNGNSTSSKENDKTMTFTHLEIMRNELAHIMQIANKDKEIGQLQKHVEELQVQHAEILVSKDDEIGRIETALKQAEADLSNAEEKLAAEVMEHSKTIEVLMQTQYDFHELKGRSWFQPLFCSFS